MTDKAWRVEADDEWLARHSSENFAHMRRRFPRLAARLDGISSADLGPLGGAPRNPRLKIGGRTYSVVRYAEYHISHTQIAIDIERCRACGRRLVERHQITRISDGGRQVVGSVRKCRSCQATSWLFYSRMPTTVRARERDSKVVL